MVRFAFAALLALLVLPASALAATAEVTDGQLRIRTSDPAAERVTLLPVDGTYLVRRDRLGSGTLAPGAGCQVSRPRELRCSGDIRSIDVQLTGDTFSTQHLSAPLTVTGGDGRDFVFVGGGPGQPTGSTAPVTVDTRGGRDSIVISGVTGVPYTVDGGAGDDVLEGVHPLGTPSPSFTLRGGDGNDRITGDTGADELDGGPGSDTLRGNGGADTLLGGAGSDTAIFAPTPQAPLSVTLDGVRNDGAAGENALVGTDVENVTFVTPYEGGPVPGGNTLIGNDGPNVLVGAGTVRGLGGDDVVAGAGAQGNDLDGGDGNDRVGARVTDGFTDYLVHDTIACGGGEDTAFVDRTDPRPADCEHFNLGMRPAAATARVGPDGRAAVRVSCDDIVACDLGNVLLRYKNHVVSEFSRAPRVMIAPGHSVVRRVRLTRGFRRPGRFQRVVVKATPRAYRFGQPGEVTAGFPRVITLIRSR